MHVGVVWSRAGPHLTASIITLENLHEKEYTFVSQNLEEPIQESDRPLHHDAPQPFARGVQVLVLIHTSILGGIQPRRWGRLPPVERLRRITGWMHSTKRGWKEGGRERAPRKLKSEGVVPRRT